MVCLVCLGTWYFSSVQEVADCIIAAVFWFIVVKGVQGFTWWIGGFIGFGQWFVWFA